MKFSCKHNGFKFEFDPFFMLVGDEGRLESSLVHQDQYLRERL